MQDKIFLKKLEHWEKPHVWRVSFSESKGFQRDSFFTMLNFGVSASQTSTLPVAQLPQGARELQLYPLQPQTVEPGSEGYGPAAISISTTNTWVGRPRLPVSAHSLDNQKDN